MEKLPIVPLSSESPSDESGSALAQSPSGESGSALSLLSRPLTSLGRLSPSLLSDVVSNVDFFLKAARGVSPFSLPPSISILKFC